MKVLRVLVFPAGTEVGLEVHQALKDCKDIEVYGAGQAGSNHASFVYERYYEIPSIYQDNWLKELISLCKKENIDCIIPAYDDVIVSLIEFADQIPAAIITSCKKVCNITRSKKLTYQHLAEAVRVPKMYSINHVNEYPVLIKPDRGQGSQGVVIAHNMEELLNAIKVTNSPLILEYLPGEEFTVDCFSDREKGLLFSSARHRLRMRNGIAVHTKGAYLIEANDIALRIQSKLNMWGAWFFQVKRACDGELTLLEVAPRVAGSMSLHRIKGVNFPLLSIYEHYRYPIELMILGASVELSRSLQNKYLIDVDYSSLYIDLDDTLILNEKINLDALKLVYSCINRKIPVFLITRHSGNLTKTLDRYRINGIFDDVIHIKDGASKAEYINDKNAIFVDDSFSERQKVAQELNIPTFDCSMIEALISCHPLKN